jgi:hypothetical protein
MLLDTKKPAEALHGPRARGAVSAHLSASQPTDPASFDRHALLYGVESRLTVGWGPAFLSSISGPA